MIDPIDLRITSYLPQSGYGAGGMTVGLTTSGIIVHHIPSGIGISCDSERSQHANKEKAIQMLTSLVLAIESEKQMTWRPEPSSYAPLPVGPHGIGKVNMIKEVRVALGCGLKEAKDLVDKHYHLINCKQLCELEYRGGQCTLGDACVCGGDLLSVRAGCYNWSKL